MSDVGKLNELISGWQARLDHGMLDSEIVSKREWRVSYLCGRCEEYHHLRGPFMLCLGGASALMQLGFPQVTMTDEAYAMQSEAYDAETRVPDHEATAAVVGQMTKLFPNAPVIGVDMGSPGGDETALAVAVKERGEVKVLGYAKTHAEAQAIIAAYVETRDRPWWRFWKRS